MPVNRSLRHGTNLQSVKWQNRAAVLETLWRSQPISRKDLAARTHLTPATLTNIVAELRDAGIVQEVGLGEQTLGRRPMMLTFVPERYYLLGVNLSRTDLSIAVFDMRLRPQHLDVHPITTRVGSAVETLEHLIRYAISTCDVDPQRIVAIGISSPGPLSERDGVIFAPPQFDEWRDLPLGRVIRERFELPTWLENDANANALAEHLIGAGKDLRSFIYIEVHSGVGAGIILDGQLFTGSAGVAAELGHTSIDRNGPRCPCGNYGCVELYASGPAIVAQARAWHAAGQATMLTGPAGDNLCDLTLEQIISAAQDGDALACATLDEASRALGYGLVNAINLFDPQAVIIGHKLNQAGAVVLDPIRDVIRAQAIPQAAARERVLASTIPEPVAVTGAACRALSGILRHPNLLLGDN
jgi:N-acetylglucosamine repressor